MSRPLPAYANPEWWKWNEDETSLIPIPEGRKSISRQAFVPAHAPKDVPYPFGYEQTVPTEQFANAIADLVPQGAKVLEIGLGSGYVAAVVAQKATSVRGVEIQPLDHYIAHVAHKLPANVTFVQADGCTYESGEQFDVVLVSFCVPRVCHNWITQLRDGGLLIMPLKGEGPLSRVCVYEKQGHELKMIRTPFYAAFTEMVQPEGK